MTLSYAKRCLPATKRSHLYNVTSNSMILKVNFDFFPLRTRMFFTIS